MQRIDNSSAISARPAPAAPGTPGYFTGGNAALSLPATIVDADWLNMVQEELISAVVAAGLTPDKTNDNQLLAAIISLSRHGEADNVYYNGTPASGINPGFTRTLSFVAPCNGFVLAMQSANCPQQPGAMQNFVSITGSTSGSSSVSDQTLFSMTNVTTRPVQAGETVSVKGLLNTDATVATWSAIGMNLSYIFVPSL